MTTLTQTPGKSTNRVDWSKWIRFALLVMAGGTIYKLANLKDAFYVPMQEAMGLSHTEIGTLLSVNSMVATALFIVGGYLADRFSTRILIPLGLVGTGTLGLFLSTFPGFGTLLLLFALLAVCSDCLVWPALLKSIRQLGGSKEQGRLFGLLEGGRGVVDTA
ncbi:MAG TPA: MFS transporter, partial [Gemmatimonadales bacterium]|nr:MFS transporter [Gemmatimonadales bacterium]